MALFEWSDQYSVNVKEMDLQHLKLVQLINELYRVLLSDNPDNILPPVMDELVDYTAVHFSSEEELLLRYQVPGFEAHRLSHLKFVEKVLADQVKLHNGQLQLNTKIVKFLKDWLIEHIIGEDKKYGIYLNAHGVF